MADEDAAVIRGRLAVDVKPFKRILSKFKALEDSKESSESTSCLKECLLELGLLEQSVRKLELIQGTALIEVASIRQECNVAKEEIDKSRLEVGTLQTDLAREEKRRQNRLEYDKIAKEIETLPSRETSLQAIRKLENEVDELRREDEAYEQTKAIRRQAFGEIVKSLEDLQASIRSEKEEQERKEGMAEDEDEQDVIPTGTEPEEAAAVAVAAAPALAPAVSQELKKELNPAAKEFTPDTMDLS